ncbi:MAG: ABC transporter permease subunit, partial [Firmicutes bacterium]|nr:ABC transporter permease subunit [Bacillota bacterium]
MNKRAAKAIITKDIKAISSNIQLWLPMIVVPLFFSLVLPLVLVLPARFTDLSAIGNSDVIMRLFSQLPPGRLRETIFAFPAVQQQIVYFTVNYLFAPFFLLIPLMTASVIGANSFAGEKERKTLETLLFAPLDLNTLFWAKILAAFLPAT